MEIQRPEFINYTFVGYVPDPDGRGTLSLLFSCLVTLSLCVWSAIHLDLPPYGESDIEYAYRYLKWSVLGVFGPELVIWAAWRQFISARTLTKYVKERSNNGQRNVNKRQQWTMVHGFYAGMGGFVFDTATTEMLQGPPFVPQRRLHLTPRGVQLLARCGLLPDISVEEIKDKSKTDGSGKLICYVQVGWMVVQAAVRVAVGLPITPLETNTIGHVVCALINYALWWYKPKWIKEPTILRGDWTREMCAFMYMSSQVSQENKVSRDVLRDFGVKTEMSGVLYTPSDYSSENARSHEESNEDIQLTRPNGAFATKGHMAFNDECEPSAQALHIENAVTKTTTSAMRDTGSNRSWWCASEELVVERPRNWPGDDLLRHMQGHLMGIILWSSSTVYGAVHIAGWNEIFPTDIESWFWRASGAYIVFSGLLWSLLNLMGHLSGSVWWFWYGILEGAERKRSHVLIYVLCCIGGTFYVVARVYLVLEAFISLRSLPASAYDSPSCILTVPHI
ncbi:hypothetical protein BBK36DRAFT_141418 [Trichoderma citrinoviride]|uniref:Uncharacterized protein n=1 Tax=Trichoderma citrinoviride TaxID=58853 RepID=A0A2T4B653_9HYPO|nr:hypothetical protein BBK36DRAFT_141418 [Trichoderma citrinoviride]PTB64813.1 hypothetical protein BBK36DRAFT_141418 [Trichoderma citrinoviride]